MYASSCICSRRSFSLLVWCIHFFVSLCCIGFMRARSSYLTTTTTIDDNDDNDNGGGDSRIKKTPMYNKIVCLCLSVKMFRHRWLSWLCWRLGRDIAYCDRNKRTNKRKKWNNSNNNNDIYMGRVSDTHTHMHTISKKSVHHRWIDWTNSFFPWFYQSSSFSVFLFSRRQYDPLRTRSIIITFFFFFFWFSIISKCKLIWLPKMIVS